MRITAEHVEALAGIYLSPRYDNAQPTPDFHRECWARYCSEVAAAATAAPRSHAKSTGLTHDYILANVLYRTEEYVILVGASEEMAIEHLGDIATEMRENEDLIRDFKIKGFLQEQKTDIIVECADGHQFRILARGAEQKIRGRKWRGKRPGLIVCDDLEDDEQVENKERRSKFRKWFFRACKQALRQGGRIRVHGTILHVDSLLMHLMKNPSWASRLYKAHRSFSDFSDKLWPERFPESTLRAIRQEFMNEGDSAGYSQEYLNDPQDFEDRFLRPEEFIPMKEENFDAYKNFFVGVDFAISKKDTANRTSFTVGGKEISNLTDIIDEHVGRWDALQIVEKFFEIEERWKPECFFVEDGQIWKAIEPVLLKEMQHRDKWIRYEPLKPITDKKSRARTFQKRMRAGAVRFNSEAGWYIDYREELLLFTGDAEAMADDQLDSTATLFLGMEKWTDVNEEDQLTDEEIEFDRLAQLARKNGGRSKVTGY